MKKFLPGLLLALTLFSFLPALSLGQEVPPANMTREVHSIWKNNDLFLFGYHKPYTSLKVYNGEKVLGETMTDALGKFEITVKGLNTETNHTIVVKAFDRYGREIKDILSANTNSVAVENVVEVPVSPGTIYQGQLTDQSDKTELANATIKVYDKKTNALLAQTRSDAAGNFAFTGVPKESYLVVEKEGYGLTKQDLTGPQLDIPVSKSGNYTPPVSTNANKNTTAASPAEKSGEEGNPILTYVIVFAVVAILIGIVFVGLKLKKGSEVK